MVLQNLDEAHAKLTGEEIDENQKIVTWPDDAVDRA